VPRILVTGGCGFIGANLVPRLLAAGAEVRVLDNLRSGQRKYLDGLDVELVEADVNDRTAVASALAGVDAVVHLAAAGSVIESISDPLANFTANVGGTFSLLDEVRKAGVDRFVFASTGGALIGNAAPPVDENSVPKPISPYGASKLAAEGYCHAFASAYGLRTIALRFANVYGPLSAHKRGALNAFFTALRTDQPIVIYGDGSASRDFLYVDDICFGLELGLSTDVPGGTVVHVSTGVETTVLELAEACCQVAGKPDHPIEFRPARTGEVTRNFANYDKAARLLGYSPAVPLANGLKLTWDWFLDSVG
jgi:UDP-glucose 4-epimerase